MSEIDPTDHDELGADDPTVLPLDPDVAGTDASEREQADPAARPLRLPPARSVGERRVAQRLGGHVTSGAWLSANLWPELDRARAEHGRLRGRAAAEINSLAELERDWRHQDADYVKRLQDAAREGREPPADSRVPPAARELERTGVLDRAWASLAALADLVDSVVALVRECEEAWLGTLREQYAEAGQARREAERLVREAEAREWRAAQLGRWLQGVSDDGPLRGQPAPGLEPRPPVVSEQVIAEGLERTWHRPRPTAA